MKRILALLLVVILLVNMVPVHAHAATTTTTHSHPVCGSSCSCASDTHSSSTWQAWDGTTKMYNGDYYLTQDVVLSSTMILDYSYTSRLCLNGHSITCEDRVFDIYSYRSLLITDCKGTGRIETTGDDCAIGNNKYLSIWGGTILNSSDSYYGGAVDAYQNTTTYVCGGTVKGKTGSGIFMHPGSKVNIQGGEVKSESDCAINSNGSTGAASMLTVSGGHISGPANYDAVSLGTGEFIMTGGSVDGNVNAWSANGTKVSGGTINGYLYSDAADAVISGGNMELWIYGDGATVSAGTFHGTVFLDGEGTTISGGNFTDCALLHVRGKTWICGGMFSTINAQNVPLYISGVPEIDTLQVGYANTVSAKNEDNSGSYGGDPIQVTLGTTTTWKDGDIVIKNVTSDAVAQKFTLVCDDARWMYLERYNDNLVLRILPHGTWGTNVTWGLEDGVLIVPAPALWTGPQVAMNIPGATMPMRSPRSSWSPALRIFPTMPSNSART